MKFYRVFTRAARSFEEFATAERITHATGVSLNYARAMCSEFNSQRSPHDIEIGRKMEFVVEN